MAVRRPVPAMAAPGSCTMPDRLRAGAYVIGQDARSDQRIVGITKLWSVLATPFGQRWVTVLVRV